MTSLSNDLNRITNKFPVRPFQVDVSINDLESVLSLPIWKKRYDLYSVWIATEIVRSLDGHDVEIHHDGGRIVFAFKETLVATIHTSPGPYRLISERRIPLKDPRGEGRKGAVQPDHGLWTVVHSDDVCKMAIEVKHYKKAAKAKFVDVFEDYARALPAGEIYLVNHGPTGKAVYEVSRTVRDRCFAIQHLTTSHSAAREDFASAVRGCVGEPLQSWPEKSATTDGDTVLLFDVSGSMTSTMRSEAMKTFVRNIAAADLPAKLVAVDRSIMGSWDTSEAGFASLLGVDGGSTNLSPAIAELLKSYDSVVVVTDNDGLGTVSGVQIALHDLKDVAPPGIVVRVCKKL